MQTAESAVTQHGTTLVGRIVDTPPLGEWAGGACRVTEVAPDPEAPDIAFNVKRLADGAENGVFGREVVTVLGE